MNKYDYVRSEIARNAPTRHECHWPGCQKKVAPAVWGCKPHWYALPQRLRNRIWATFKSGQEVSKTPSREYIAVAKEVQEWIALNWEDCS